MNACRTLYIFLKVSENIVLHFDTISLDLESGGSNAVCQSNEEEKDEGEGCVPHAVCHNGIAPLAVSHNQEVSNYAVFSKKK